MDNPSVDHVLLCRVSEGIGAMTHEDLWNVSSHVTMLVQSNGNSSHDEYYRNKLITFMEQWVTYTKKANVISELRKEMSTKKKDDFKVLQNNLSAVATIHEKKSSSRTTKTYLNARAGITSFITDSILRSRAKVDPPVQTTQNNSSKRGFATGPTTRRNKQKLQMKEVAGNLPQGVEGTTTEKNVCNADTDELEALKIDHEAIVAEKQRLNMTLTQVKQKNHELYAKLNDANNAQDEASALAKSLQHKLDSYEAKVNQCNTVQAQLEITQRSERNLRGIKESLENELDELKKKNTCVQDEVSKLKSELEQSQKELVGREKLTRESVACVASALTDLDGLTRNFIQETKHLVAKFRNTEGMNEQLRNGIDKLIELVEKQEEEMEAHKKKHYPLNDYESLV
jgi:hypothetical protein